MGLLSSLFQRRVAVPPDDPLDAVQRARTRARRRLVGAVVLLGIAVVGFPVLFETHPRPIPVDIPITIANRDSAPPLALPPARVAASAAEAERRAPAIGEAASDAAREGAPAAAAPAASPVPAGARAASAVAAAEPPPPAPRAVVASAPAPAEAASAGPPAGRFVVQVGAFAEASGAREARLRVEKLGLKTYTQVVETAGGSRIRVRVGPFASREEADRAAGRIKSAGLPAALLAL